MSCKIVSRFCLKSVWNVLISAAQAISDVWLVHGLCRESVEALPRPIYDGDPLAETLDEYDAELIVLHRSNRKPDNKALDGRPLLRYKRRWTLERTIGWIQNFRRLSIQWEILGSQFSSG